MNNTFDDVFGKIYEKRQVFYYCDNCERKEKHFGDAQNIAEMLSQYGTLSNGWVGDELDNGFYEKIEILDDKNGKE